MANIESDHKLVYSLKLLIGYYSSQTRLVKITETCLVNMPYNLNECIIVTFDGVTGKFTMNMLEGVSMQFYREGCLSLDL